MKKILSYFSLIKFSHTIFALPFAFIGFILAIKNKEVSHEANFTTGELLEKLLLMLLCMIFARSTAMAFNRYIDRKYDALNPRTQSREIPAGTISTAAALTFTMVAAVLFMTTTYFINSICFYLSPIALLVVLGYSYTKRFTAFCHLVLGIGLGLSPIGAYLTLSGSFAWLPILFSLAVVFWVSGFDIIYALQDESFDRQNNLKSVPAALGGKNALMISRLLHTCSATFIVIAGFYGQFHFVYWCGAILFCFFLFYQHRLVRVNDLSRVNLAFFTLNGIASIVFGCITILAVVLNL